MASTPRVGWGARWEIAEGRELAAGVLGRLAAGGSFDDLGVGRVDLRGYQVPPPRVLRRFRWSGLAFGELAEVIKVAGVTWRSLDLSGAGLEHLRVEGARIEDCRLDRASLLDLGMWESTRA